jgi:hypothetical protein
MVFLLFGHILNRILPVSTAKVNLKNVNSHGNRRFFIESNKKERPKPLFDRGNGLQSQFATAVVADALVLVQGDLLVAAAEDAAGLMLAQDDGIALGIDLQGIATGHIQSLTQFDGQSDAAQIINVANDAGRFHNKIPPSISLIVFTYFACS